MKYYEILKDFDPNTNARDIVMFYINKFKKTPSPYWANQLSAFGVEVDYDPYDCVFVTEADFNHVTN
jgi:hypothetical protein